MSLFELGLHINQALKKSNVKDKNRKSLTLIVGIYPKIQSDRIKLLSTTPKDIANGKGAILFP